MKLLGLLRHAKSDWSDSRKADIERGLNDRGRRGATLMGEHIARHGVAWNKVIASPAERVRDTLASALPNAEVDFDRRLYLASAETICEVVAELGGDSKAVLVSGHNPGLQDMLFTLVAPADENALFDEAKVKFPTASFAVYQLAIDSWADLGPECGTLVHFARPRDFDAELGPEG